jgi:hypothetical protein
MAEEPTEEEAQRVFEALDSVEAMPDPLERARVIGRLLKDQAERNKRFMEYRRQVVLQLRAQKPPVPYRRIAAELGVSLGTVQDIERGAAKWSARMVKGEGHRDDTSGNRGDGASRDSGRGD